MLATSPRADLALIVAYLMGVVPQGKLGIGYASLSALEVKPARDPHLPLQEIDAVFDHLVGTSGPGARRRREQLLEELFAATDREGQRFLAGLITGELRQGAQEGLMVEAVAAAYGIEPALVRRAAMLAGDLVAVAGAAADGGRDAVEDFGLTLFQPVQPMLAQAAPDVREAMERLSHAALEWKFDGARLQIHVLGERVRLFSRNLRDITSQLPGVVEKIRSLGIERGILDGEVIAMRSGDRPAPFQETVGRFASHEDPPESLNLFVFDALHLGGEDLIDMPDRDRRSRLETSLPRDLLVPRIETSDLASAEAFFADAVERGHEGVVVKSPDAAYEAGRRGVGWIKVKPVHTLDLVVLAVEWGTGRRRGLLSNIHLGARDEAAGGFVMLGKTFKGMTDEVLAWQTERFLDLETQRDGRIVHVRPEQVVEIAFDGLQASSRYPGGMALRFARVRRYRDDKTSDQADTIATVRSIFERSRS